MTLPAARVQPHADPRPSRTRWLRPVTAPAARRRPKLAGAALAVGGALAIAAAQMGISLAATQDAYVLAGLNNQQSELNLQKQALNDELVGLNSPQALAKKADAMGLVVAGSASYLRLSDGAVMGAGQGADWLSTVSPNGATKVANSLIAPPPPPVAEKTSPETPASDAAAQPTEPALPPAITDGLPSPTTR
jgi:hypothetical protein